MKMSFHRIGYQDLDVCNAVSIDVIEDAVGRTNLVPGAKAIDIGCGNGGVSARLASRFGLAVEAVELDPAMAELARERTAGTSVAVREAQAGPVLKAGAPWDLIVCMGATNPTELGLLDPAPTLTHLKDRLRPGGWLLWGDLTWMREPATPLRQIWELSGRYADDAGWRAAAEAAGLEIVWARLSSQAEFDAFSDGMVTTVRDWLAANPDHPDHRAVAGRCDQMAMMLDFARGVMGFGLYLLRRPI